MKPAAFDYYAPTSLDETLELLASVEDAKVLAGGQSLIPMMNMRLARPSTLVDLRRVEALSQRSVRSDGVTLGAMTRHRTVEMDRAIASAYPLLPCAARLISHFQIRERGTIGGSLAHADPSAEWPMVAVLLDAVLTLQSRDGTRETPARDFFLSLFTTSLEPGEIVTQVRFPALSGDSGWGIREVAQRPGDFAIVVASAVTGESNARYSAASIALAGTSATPILASCSERLIGEKPSPELWRSVAEAAAEEIDPESDAHATAQDRRELVRGLVTAVLHDAHRRSAPR